jgi:formyltetrahydrofolate deformylase
MSMSVVRSREYVVTLSRPDKPGVVYAVSSFPVQHSANILVGQQYGESQDGRFFMRAHFSVSAQDDRLAGELQLARLERGFSWRPRRLTCPGGATTRRGFAL